MRFNKNSWIIIFLFFSIFTKYALAMRPGDIGVSTPCMEQWAASICADETAVHQTWKDYVSVSSMTDRMMATLPDIGNREEVELDIDASINAGDGAMVAIIDLDKFTARRPDVANKMIGAALICATSSQDKCSAQMNSFLSNLKKDKKIEDDVKATSLWGHACNKDDTISKRLTRVQNRGGYMVAAIAANSGSSSRINVTMTHHTPKMLTQQVCGTQITKILKPGDYHNQSIGTIKIDVPAQNQGSLNNYSLKVIDHGLIRGVYNLSTTTPGATANILFTGKVLNCAN